MSRSDSSTKLATFPAAEKPWLSAYGNSTREHIGPFPFPHLPEMIRATAATYGDRKAFSICLPNGADAHLSFRQVDVLSDRFAVYLRSVLGLVPGDRVAIQMPNCLAYPVVSFAVFKAGLILVNTNPLYTVHEMVKQYEDSKPKALVIIDLFGDKVAPVVAETGIPHVVVCRLTDFFPALKGLFIQTVLRFVKKQIPTVKGPHHAFVHALELGKAKLAEADLAAWSSAIDEGSTAVLQYTGGTTGTSKAAELTHGNLLANFSQTIELCGRSLVPGKETILTALPLYHIFAFTVNLLTFYRIGSHNVLVPSPRPLTNLKAPLEKYPFTWATGVNTLFAGLCDQPWFKDAPPPSLKYSIAGGTALHGTVAEKWERITRSQLVEGYGLSECSPVVAVNPIGGRIKRDSIGVPLPSTMVRIVDENRKPLPIGETGELAVYGPQVMRGYWGRPEETAAVLADGWLYTGDMATLDAEGFLKIVDRKKEVIVVSGFKVFPNEVEEVLTRHPLVAEAAVIGVEDEHSGEVPKAFVVPRRAGLSPEMLRSFCETELARYKVPRSFEFRKELPKTPVGKILRRVLREEYLKAHPPAK